MNARGATSDVVNQFSPLAEEIAARLPSGWELKNLGALCEKPQYGWTTKANKEGGGVKFLRTTDITPGFVEWSTVPYCSEEPNDLEKYLIRDGDLLISRAGSVGVSHLVSNPEPAVFASYLIRFRPKADVSAKYLRYYLQSPTYWRAIGTGKLGIAVQNVNATTLSQIPVPVAPKQVQAEIVAEIEKQFSRLDGAVSDLKRVQTTLNRYCRAQIAAACPRPGTPLPSGWRWLRLPDLGELARGKSRHRPRDDPKLYGGRYPFIQTGDIRASGGRIRKYSQTYSEVGLVQSRLWPKGTLCITIAANIAETGILEFDACFPDSVVGLRIEGRSTLVRFVELYLRSIKDSLDRLAPATAQKNINLGVLARIEIPVPPEDVVDSLVAGIEKGLSIAEQMSAQITVGLVHANRLKQGILGAAFGVVSTRGSLAFEIS